MDPGRRRFLKGCGAGAAAWAASRLVPGTTVVCRAHAAPLPEEKLRALAAHALEQARKAGATYADIRINRYRTQVLWMRTQKDVATGTLHQVPAVSDEETFGFGVRVIAGGAWGFAASSRVTFEEIARVAREAVEIGKAHAALRLEPVRLAPVAAATARYQTPIAKDPFQVPIGEKLELLRAASAEAKKVRDVFVARAYIAQRVEHRFFASTEGSVIVQDVYQIASELGATAVTRGRKPRSRTYRPHAVTAGYEAVERANLVGEARRVGEEAVAGLKAPPVEPGVKDLVLLPTNLSLTIHESLGHSTELDRALGYEANFAGSSFLTLDKLGRFRVGSDLVNVYGDRIRKESLATCAYDDDGVKTRQFPIVQAGIFVGFQTIRDQAHLVGQSESMGCCYADSFASFPFQRMPNVWLEPSSKPMRLADLIAGVDDGILIEGRGSYSIDQQRYNFQFGGDAFWEIKGGKVGRRLTDVAYQSRTPDFWQSCDGLGGPDTWENVGLNADGKGEPMQLNAMSHGCPPARFRRVSVLRTG